MYLLRGVGFYLKSHMLWRHWFFVDEMGIDLHLALEAGLGTLRKRLSATAGKDVSYAETFTFVETNFRFGTALSEFWQERRDDRNMLLHPDNDISSDVIPPLSADDIFELFDPMLSLYRYLLIGTQRLE